MTGMMGSALGKSQQHWALATGGHAAQGMLDGEGRRWCQALTCDACRWEDVLECPGEGIEQHPLAGSLAQVLAHVAQQNSGVGADAGFLIDLWGRGEAACQ